MPQPLSLDVGRAAGILMEAALMGEREREEFLAEHFGSERVAEALEAVDKLSRFGSATMPDGSIVVRDFG